MIEKQQATVYYAPTRGRRYFTRSAAINAEARAIIKKHYPDQPSDPDDPGWSMERDETMQFASNLDRLVRALSKGGA